MKNDSMTRKNIVLMTDFGYTDNYVGILKGVISNIAPNCNIIDLTHNIQPQNIKQAAFVLKNSIDYFPENSIFVPIVDPGVGSNRKAMAVKTENYYFVAPDNGILTYVFDKEKCIQIVEITNLEFTLPKISTTFHGRDIFAPVSAHISNGISLNKLGNNLKSKDIKRIKNPYFEKFDNNSFSGETIYYDNFGNLITSLEAEKIGINDSNLKDWSIETDKHKIKGISKSFSEVKDKQLLAYIGSFGYIEIAIRNGNASKHLGLNKKNRINLYKT